MGKHKKQLKLEKSKVKLKAKKLTKGANITDTNFKVKKIIIKEQHSTNKSECSANKGNLKEYLTQLQHHNVNRRMNALNNIKDLILQQENETLGFHLSKLIDAIARLILDSEKSVRRESFRVMEVILRRASGIDPFFYLLTSFLQCAITNINSGIREDSLLFLDKLLNCVPLIAAKNANGMFVIFLDIMKYRLRSKTEGMLNLDSNVTTLKWKLQFFFHLNNLLRIIINEEKRKNINTVKDQKFEFNRCYPIYNRKLLETPKLKFFHDHDDTGIIESEVLHEFAEVLIPLLFETWREATPSNKTNKSQTKESTTITTETADCLKTILEIMKLLWELMDIFGKYSSKISKSEIFFMKYDKDFSEYIIKPFPYSLIDSRKSENNTSVKIDGNCVHQNLLIAYLFCNLHKTINSKDQQQSADSVLKYIKAIKNVWIENEITSKLLFQLLKKLFSEVYKTWKSKRRDIIFILHEIIDCCLKNQFSQDLTLNITGLFVEEQYNDIMKNDETVALFLSTIPNRLINEEINSRAITILVDMCRRNSEVFMKNLKANYVLLFEQVIKTNNTGSEKHEANLRIFTSLLHWIKDGHYRMKTNEQFNSIDSLE